MCWLLDMLILLIKGGRGNTLGKSPHSLFVQSGLSTDTKLDGLVVLRRERLMEEMMMIFLPSDPEQIFSRISQIRFVVSFLTH
jgi:hypothetical protein